MLSPAERSSLLAHARLAVREAAAGRKPAAPAPPSNSPALAAAAGAFVTLHSGVRALRGCIGYVEARRALWVTVWDAARQAALDDPRFEPVKPVEVDSLAIEISVLGTLQSADAASVRVGQHGIVLSRGPRRGLLLPQVAVERGWDTERFLDAGCEKAGLPPGAWREAGAKIEVFTAEVFGT
ncbi:MAG: AmmeMemoRadiSam system protein A [Planctomycetota bacterium]